MSNILVFVEQSDGKVSKAGLSALEAANQLKAKTGGSVSALTLGQGAKAAGESLGGACSQFYFSEGAAFESYRAVAYTNAAFVACEQGSCSIFMVAATSCGRDFSARLAARLQAGQASDIIAVNADGSFKRPIYAGNAIADVEITTQKKVITVRPTAFNPIACSGQASGTELAVEVDDNIAGKVIGVDRPESARPELSDASIVVSGGRALQSAENFEKYIFPLADALGAAVGASRAAVDSGYAPNDWQVGQTGKVVAPSLYIAVGISGAIQHLAGMKDSKVIVAINKDPEAPIFEVADYGLVADLYQVIEPLTAAFKANK